MAIELVERLDEAASELLVCVKRGEISSEEALEVLSGTRAVRGKLDTVQALAAATPSTDRNPSSAKMVDARFVAPNQSSNTIHS